MSDTLCSADQSNVTGIQIMNPITRKLHFTKVIYNYKDKTEKQIQASVQLEIDMIIYRNPAYKFVNSKSHFNKTGGIDLQLNFELK